MKKTVTILASLVVVAAGASAAPKKAAVAPIEAKSGSAVEGSATFKAKGGRVTMKVVVSGLEPGPHAIHLHEKGDCSAPDAMSAGGHWNPTSAAHGRWGTDPFHHGDIGNLTADAKGNAVLEFETDLWTIGGEAGTDILGKSVVVHASVDDFTTQPTGAAGERIGCGVIREK